jgi:MoaA/NifB/PqqE/SkfB family radical SAM enzyme
MLTEKEQQNRDRLKISKPLVYDKVIRYEERLAKGESIAVIQIQGGYLCNFTCEHCAVSTFQKSNKRVMTPADLKDFCDQAHDYGLAQIDFSGGEPLAFHDLEARIKAVGPERFFLQIDTNGYLMTDDKVKWLKGLGVDKIQIGFDSFIESEHDAFRNKPGSYKAILRAVDAINKHGMILQFATVVTPERLYSQEFENYLTYADSVGARVNVLMPKLSGEWEGRTDLLFSQKNASDLDAILSRHVDAGWRLTKRNGMDIGCGAVKRIISLTAFGDVLPCIWMYFSLGNIFNTPLRDILEKGMRYFGKYQPRCLTSMDVEFNKKYIFKTYASETVPVPIERIFNDN